MNIKDFKWTEKRFGTRFANILKKLGGLSKDATDGSIEYKDEQGNVTKLVTDSTFSSLLAKNGLIEVKWQELKDKRDNGQLISGSLYRITDYNCTTTQENTQSAGHQFDIVLLALSENKLAEEGWAMEHPTDVYDVTFMDGVTKKCYLYYTDADYCNLVLVDSLLGCSEIEKHQLVIDNVNKTISTDVYSLSDLNEENLTYNYFQNSNLSAWKVWYCLDNDKSRFAWADDRPAIEISFSGQTFVLKRISASDRASGDVNYYAWHFEEDDDTFYTITETPTTEDKLYTINDEEVEGISITNYFPSIGRGVIYRLIDEFNNDVCFDFKNIQHYTKQHQDTGYYDDNGTYKYVYTFNIFDVKTTTNIDGSSEGQRFIDDDGNINHTVDNVIKVSTISKNDEIIIKCIPETIFMSRYAEGTGGTKRNTIENSSVIISNYSIYNNYLKDCNVVRITSAVGNNNSYLYCRGTFSTRASSVMFIGNKKVSTEN